MNWKPSAWKEKLFAFSVSSSNHHLNSRIFSTFTYFWPWNDSTAFHPSRHHLLERLGSDGFMVFFFFPPFYSVLAALSGVLKWYQAPPWHGMMIFQELAGRLVWGSYISINRSSISISEPSYIYIYIHPGDDSFPLPQSSSTLRLVTGESSFPFLLFLLFLSGLFRGDLLSKC